MSGQTTAEKIRLGVAAIVAVAAFMVATVFFRDLARFSRFFFDSSHLGTVIRIANLSDAAFDGLIILVLSVAVIMLLGRSRKQRWVKVTIGIAWILAAVWGLYAGQL
jgi:hypothetical protein